MFAKNSNLSKKPFDNKRVIFASAFAYHASCASFIGHIKLPSAHCLLVLLPQSEKWLVLEGLIHPPEYIKPGSIEGEIK